jgi:elongation factor G
MGVDPLGSSEIIKAKTPLAELNRYSTSLRSLSQGKAQFRQRFAEFAPVSMDIQQRVAKALHSVDAE